VGRLRVLGLVFPGSRAGRRLGRVELRIVGLVELRRLQLRWLVGIVGFFELRRLVLG
jgi:hypothetical protein